MKFINNETRLFENLKDARQFLQQKEKTLANDFEYARITKITKNKMQNVINDFCEDYSIEYIKKAKYVAFVQFYDYDE